jgi:hypothetical protein
MLLARRQSGGRLVKLFGQRIPVQPQTLTRQRFVTCYAFDTQPSP